MTELKRWIVVSDPRAKDTPIVVVKLKGVGLDELLGLTDKEKQKKLISKMLESVSSGVFETDSMLEKIMFEAFREAINNFAKKKGYSLQKALEEVKKTEMLTEAIVNDALKIINTWIKEGRTLPIAYANPSLIERLQAEHRVVTFRYWKDRSLREKVNMRAIIEPREDLPENEVLTIMDTLLDKIGETEVEVEAFRAKAWQVVVDDRVASKILGLKVGDEIDGSIVGLDKVKLRITGGSDATGIPIRPDVPGPVKKRVLLSGPPGFHPRLKGERRRKLVRGNVISDGTVKRDKMVQINTVIIYPSEKQS